MALVESGSRHAVWFMALGLTLGSSSTRCKIVRVINPAAVVVGLVVMWLCHLPGGGSSDGRERGKGREQKSASLNSTWACQVGRAIISRSHKVVSMNPKGPSAR